MIEKQMPKYVCHKEVWALKIADVQPSCGNRIAEENEETDGGVFLIFEDKSYEPKKMDYQFNRKHSPQAGGYFVVYKDGYQSFSPAEAFEDGYKLKHP